MVIEKALKPVLNLDDFPGAVFDIFIEFPQTDAGTRCAGITAAAMALADAGVEMKDMVSAVAVGTVGGQMVADLDYAEEAYEDGPVSDIPVAFIPSTGELTLLQMDGEISKEDLIKALEMGKTICERIAKVQKQALRAKYTEVQK